MRVTQCNEIIPGSKIFKRIYIAIMLFVVGRAIRAAAVHDKIVKKEFEDLPDDFAFSLGALPNGPHLVMGKDKKGKIKFLGMNPVGKKITLKMAIKNIEAAILVFTFQESTAVAFAHDRFVVDGDLSDALAVVRILDIAEVYLLPKFIAAMAVKRYPEHSEMSLARKYIGRILIYARVVLGF